MRSSNRRTMACKGYPPKWGGWVSGVGTTTALSYAGSCRYWQEIQVRDGHRLPRTVSPSTAHIPAAFETVRGSRCRSEEHTSELQSHHDLVCRLLLEKKKKHI